MKICWLKKSRRRGGGWQSRPEMMSFSLSFSLALSSVPSSFIPLFTHSSCCERGKKEIYFISCQLPVSQPNFPCFSPRNPVALGALMNWGRFYFSTLCCFILLSRLGKNQLLSFFFLFSPPRFSLVLFLFSNVKASYPINVTHAQTTFGASDVYHPVVESERKIKKRHPQFGKRNK